MLVPSSSLTAGDRVQNVRTRNVHTVTDVRRLDANPAKGLKAMVVVTLEGVDAPVYREPHQTWTLVDDGGSLACPVCGCTEDPTAPCSFEARV